MLTRLLLVSPSVRSTWTKSSPVISFCSQRFTTPLESSRYNLFSQQFSSYHSWQQKHQRNGRGTFSWIALISVFTGAGIGTYLFQDDLKTKFGFPFVVAHAWSGSDNPSNNTAQGSKNYRVVYGLHNDTERNPTSPDDKGDRKSVDKSGLSRAKLSPVVPAEGVIESEQEAETFKTDASSEEALPIYLAETHPGQPEYLPESVPYLIIGAGTAGMSAARAIRASDPTARVLLISSDSLSSNPGPGEKMEYPPYMRPPLSKELWRRTVKRRKAMLSTKGDMRSHSWMFYEPENFFLKPEKLIRATYGGVALWQGREVVELDAEQRIAKLDNGHNIKFGQCLLATGGKPRRVERLEKCPKSGDDLVASGKVSYFRTIDDYRRLQELSDRHIASGGRIAVVGGGFLGSELAASLSRSGKKVDNFEVVQIYKEEGNMSHVLPDFLAKHTREYLEHEGVKTRAHANIASIQSLENGKLSLSMHHSVDNKELEEEIVDHVIVACGIEPNTSLSASSTLELDPNLGGYLVNSELEARSGVYVAGDASSYFDTLLGRRRVEHVSHAEESGALAGRNMVASSPENAEANLPRVSYRHQTSFWSSLGKELSWDAVGLIDAKNLQTHAFFAGTTADSEIGSYDLPGVVFYMKPGGRIVGVLLWNLPDDLYHDEKHFSPGRLNLARKMLKERRIASTQEELLELVKQFDIFETIDEDYQDLKSFMEAKEKQLLEESEAQSQKEGDKIPKKEAA